jgi:3-(3-hydroxy-phenyl)propionate hydroxylase
LREGEDPDEAISEHNIRTNVEAVLKEIQYEGEYELEWWSIYTANTLALDDYRVDRIFFIGDSAHIVPIFGVRGLNNGLADAENIGWKLSQVINGVMDDEVLNSYSPERRGATMDVFANASKSARFMTPPTKGWQLVRDAALSLALSQPFAGQFANPRQMEPYTYKDSSAVLRDNKESGSLVGTVLPNGALQDSKFVSDHLGTGFTLLEIQDKKGRHKPMDKDASDVDMTLTCSTLRREEFADGDLGAGFYLVRPDMHIAGYWKELSETDLLEAMKILNFKEGTQA